MKFVINQEKLGVLKNHIQSLIDSELNGIREESEEWGLGEMGELEQIDSVKQIVVNDIKSGKKKMKVYVDVQVVSKGTDITDLIYEIEGRLEQWIPNIDLQVHKIIKVK